MSQQRQFKGLPTFTPVQSPPEPSPNWSPPYQGSPTYQPPYTPPPPVQQPQWPVQPGQTSHCSRCGKELGFIDRLGLDKQMPRCRPCSNQIQQSLQRFRQTFLDATRSGIFSTSEWAALQYVAQLIATLRIPPKFSQQLLSRLASSKWRVNIQRLDRAVAQAEAQGELTDEAERHISHLQATLALPPDRLQPILQRLAHLKRHTSIQRFRRAMAQIEADGEVTDEDEQSMIQLHRSLAVPNEIASPILQRIAYLKKLTNIRKGKLPTIPTNVQLESDEICHLEMPATYHKVNAKSTTYLAGRLVATNKRLHFLSTTRGMTINWSNIMRVEVYTVQFYELFRV